MTAGGGGGTEYLTVTEESYAKHEEQKYCKDEKQLSRLHSQPSPVLSESVVSPVLLSFSPLYSLLALL